MTIPHKNDDEDIYGPSTLSRLTMILDSNEANKKKTHKRKPQPALVGYH